MSHVYTFKCYKELTNYWYVCIGLTNIKQIGSVVLHTSPPRLGCVHICILHEFAEWANLLLVEFRVNRTIENSLSKNLWQVDVRRWQWLVTRLFFRIIVVESFHRPLQIDKSRSHGAKANAASSHYGDGSSQRSSLPGLPHEPGLLQSFSKFFIE